MNQFLQKKMEAKAGKTTGTGAQGGAGGKGKNKDKKADAWGDGDEDDYNMDVQVNEKKMTETNKQAIVNIGSGWKDESVKVEPLPEPTKATKKWGDHIRPNVEIEAEAFPTLGEANTKPEKKDDEEKKPERERRAPGPATLLTRAPPGAITQTQDKFSSNDDGRIKLSNSKGIKTNSLLAGVINTNPTPVTAPQPAKEIPAPAPVHTPSPVEKTADEGLQPMRFKGKLKVDLQETSADKKRKEVEEEARKEAEQLLKFSNKKADEKKDFKDREEDGKHNGKGGFQTTTLTRKKKETGKVRES
jgi:hypothetical protein